MRVDMTIDQLVLNNFPLTASDRAILKRVVEEELTRLVAQGVAAHTFEPSGTVRAVQTEPIHLSTRLDPASLGHQIAGAIYGGLQAQTGNATPMNHSSPPSHQPATKSVP